MLLKLTSRKLTILCGALPDSHGLPSHRKGSTRCDVNPMNKQCICIQRETKLNSALRCFTKLYCRWRNSNAFLGDI